MPGGGEKMSGGAPTPPRKLLVQSQASFCFVGSVGKLMHFIPTQFPLHSASLNRLPLTTLLPSWPPRSSSTWPSAPDLRTFAQAVTASGMLYCLPSFHDFSPVTFFFFINVFIYLFVAVLGLRCRARALGAQASVVVARGLSSCGLWALELRLSSCGARA